MLVYRSTSRLTTVSDQRKYFEFNVLIQSTEWNIGNVKKYWTLSRNFFLGRSCFSHWHGWATADRFNSQWMKKNCEAGCKSALVIRIGQCWSTQATSSRSFFEFTRDVETLFKRRWWWILAEKAWFVTGEQTKVSTAMWDTCNALLLSHLISNPISFSSSLHPHNS